MPRGPRGEKRPADVIGTAIMVARIATGEIIDSVQAKNPQAVALGKPEALRGPHPQGAQGDAGHGGGAYGYGHGHGRCCADH
jgi:hypothetical protein